MEGSQVRKEGGKNSGKETEVEEMIQIKGIKRVMVSRRCGKERRWKE